MSENEKLSQAKEIVAKQYGKDSWTDVQKDFEYGMGVSKLMSIEEMLDLVCIEYAQLIIPKKELITLAKCIYSADPYGEEIVIKDLRNQLSVILKCLNIKHKFKLIKK